MKMGTIELVLLSVGLAMDAFAVAICKGLNMRKMNYKNALILALFFRRFSGADAGDRLPARKTV